MTDRESTLRLGRFAAITVLIVWGASADAGESAVSRELKIPKLEAEDVVAVTLDAAVYARAADGFSDLRIVSPEGKAVPYWLHRRTETVERTQFVPVGCQIVAVKRPTEESLELTVRRADDSGTVDEIEIVTRQRDFEHHVRVSGSDDGQPWKPLVKDGLIFDYSKFVDFGNRKIRLPKNDFRQLKLEIAAPTQEQESSLRQVRRRLGKDAEDGAEETVLVHRRPLKIEEILGRQERRVVLEKKERVERFTMPEDAVAVYQDDGKTTVEVTTGRRPIHTFAVKTKTSNFWRHVDVEQPNARGGWTKLTSGIISKVDLPGLDIESNEIGFPETRSGTIRLVVHNGDNPPLEVAGIEAEESVSEIRFVARPETAYRLQYGGGATEKPEYDVQAMQLAYSKGLEPVRGDISPAEGATLAPPRGTRVADVLTNPVFFGSVVIVAALILGLSLFQATRRVQ